MENRFWVSPSERRFAGAFTLVPRFLFAAALTICMFLSAKAQTAGTADGTFPASVGSGSGVVNGFLELPDRRILVFGQFQVMDGIGRVNILRLNADGTLDQTFLPKPGPDANVTNVVRLSDGKLMIGGAFETVDGVTRYGIARLNPDGTLDPGYVSANARIFGLDAFAVQADGKILLSDGSTIFRENPDGTVDPTFGSNGKIPASGVNRIIPLPNGQFYVVGGEFTVGGFTKRLAARLNSNGTIDQNFVLKFNYFFQDVAVQPDGKLIVVGFFPLPNSTVIRQIARITDTGDVDSSFVIPNLPTVGSFNQVILQPDGRILVRGDTGLANGRRRILRLNASGGIETSFQLAAEPDVSPTSIGLQANGAVLIGGPFSSIAGARRVGLARTNAAGVLDGNSFTGAGLQGGGAIEDALTLPDGRILICGRFDTVNGRPYPGIARLFLDGNLDEGFLPGTAVPPGSTAILNTMVLQGDGRIVIGGDFSSFNGSPRRNMARLEADGALDPTFTPNFDDSVSKIVRQPDGRLLVAGSFESVNGTLRNGFARINANGVTDSTFVPEQSVTSVLTMLPLPGGKILVGGSSGLCRRLNPNGSTDPSFQCAINGGAGTPQVFRFIVQPDRRILLCGNFTLCNNVFRGNAARVFEDGSLDTSFEPQDTFSRLSGCFDMLLQQDGKIVVVGGTFGRVPGILRMNRDGSTDASFQPGRGLDYTVIEERPVFRRILQLPDSSFLAGGNGAVYNGVMRGGLFRIFSGSSCRYSLSAASAFFPIGGGAGSVTLTTDSPTCEWTVDGVPDWVTGFPTTGTGTITFNFTVAPNAGRARTAFISIGGQQFIISQADTCSFSVAPTDISVPFAGGVASVTITASSSDCEWTALNLPPWILDFPVTGIGTQTVQFIADFNPGLARSATVSINGVTFRVNQAPNPCPFILTPKEFKVGGKVGFRNLTVATNPGCLWTARRSIGWASINSGSGGTGSGTVDFGFTRNPNLLSGRTGILFIAGQQVKINQGPGRARTTIGVFRQSNGLIYQRNSPTTGFAENEFIYGIQNDVPVSGDWDGDGQDSPGIYRNGVFYLRNSNNTGVADLEIAFGNPGDIPIVGDWDGDGVDTVGTFRNGVFFLRNSNTQGFADIVIAYGSTGDRPVVGDWDGNGTDTVGVFRNGLFYLRNANTTGFADIQLAFGAATDIPVSGDWDGDGVDTIGVYRNGQFFLRNSNTTGLFDIAPTFGSPGDLPIIGEWRNVNNIE